MDSQNEEKKKNQELIGKLIIGFVIVIEILVLALLVQELVASQFRATDRVLILIGVSFLPALLEIIRRFLIVSKFINFKVGELEVNIQGIVDETVNQKAKSLERDIEGKLSTAEEALYPIIGGKNEFAKERLAQGTLIISSKDFPANIIAVKLLISFLKIQKQKEKLKIMEIKEIIPIGGTLTNYAAVINGWVDIIIDYTGTGCLFLNVEHRKKSEEQILDQLNRVSRERFQCEWLKCLGTMTNYCVVINEKIAKKEKIEIISHLENLEKNEPIRFGTDYEFSKRRDGFLGLKNCYERLRFETVICSYNERYEFLNMGKADVAIGHTTDPEIRSFNLRILKDDKHFFPNYSEVPIARTEALNTVEGLKDALNEFSGLEFNDEHLTRLIRDYHFDSKSIDKKVEKIIEELTKKPTT